MPVFIPTERSNFTRLANLKPSFIGQAPEPFRRFADLLGWVQNSMAKDEAAFEDEFSRYVLGRGLIALGGEAYLPTRGPRVWKWRCRGPRGGKGKVIPMAAMASGQSEAWPIFMVAAFFHNAGEGADFYIEEPETHLHPKAQVEVMNVLTHLVRHDHRVVITTHSPYLLYVMNNMMQRYLNRGEYGTTAEEEENPSLDPDKVAVYRLGVNGGGMDIIDRGDTRLIDAEELEATANDLGREFDDLLDEADRKP